MSTTTLPAPLPSIEVLACGCPTDDLHWIGCVLGTAEQICAEAIAHAAGVHPLIAALQALNEAGFLGPIDEDEQAEHYLLGLLDDLYTDGLLGPAVHPDAGKPFEHPDLPPELLTGFVVGECGHRVAGSEFRAGMRSCERCPRRPVGGKS